MSEGYGGIGAGSSVGVVFGSPSLTVFELVKWNSKEMWSKRCVGGLHAVPLALSPSFAVCVPSCGCCHLL